MPVDALREVVRRHNPALHDGQFEINLRQYRDAGWTAEGYEAIAGLAAWGFAHTPPALFAPDIDRDTEIGFRVSLEVLWERLTDDIERMAPETALRWLAALVAAPPGDYRALRQMLRRDLNAEQFMGDWRPAGMFGPLAWAAGLTHLEACARQAVVTADEIEALVVLAVLRGWHLPPLLQEVPGCG